MMQEKIGFYDQIARNKRNSFILILAIFLVFLLIGYIVGKIAGPGYFFIVMIISIIFSLIYILIGYYKSDKIAIASVNAKPASPHEYKQYHNIIEGLCIASGLPKPRLYIMESEQINAFASGRNPENAVICFTTGALRKLDKHEIEGVVAHELSHIANYDIRFMTLTAILVGMVAIISEIFLRSMWLSSRDDNGKANIILLIIGVILALLAPLVVQLVSLAISRKREFMADASAVKFTRYPSGLISALKKIKNDKPMREHQISQAVAPLFISDPFKRIYGLFQTHPPIDERIRVLESM